MEDLYDTVSSGDAGEIQNYFADAKEYRDSLPVRKRGNSCLSRLIRRCFDKVGHWLTLFFSEEISITNLQILEAREGLLGVLRISFQREDRMKAKLALGEKNTKLMKQFK